jgi:putative ABC transport system substrate-binding protein
MRKSIFVLTALWLLWSPNLVQAQKVYRIGALVPADRFIPAFEGFRKKMAELGYREGKNLNYALHNARGDHDVLQKMAQQLVQDKPDVIVTSTTTTTGYVAKASAATNIPVIFLGAADPLRLVKSYASSGNNVTGVSTASIDLIDKELELLRELEPRAKRVISLLDSESLAYQSGLEAIRQAAKKLGFHLVEIHISNRDELVLNLKSLTHKNGDALILIPSVFVSVAVKEIVEHTVKHRIPTISPSLMYVERGVLAAYGVDHFSVGQQGAALVDKILKGARPTNLPIELPSKLRLGINLKTAQAIGLKIPKEILLRADEVIE